MTDGFAAAVTVSIPIFALAAGAEARAIRDRLQQPDRDWERQFARYDADHEFDPAGTPADIFAYFKDVPKLSKLHVAERAIAIAGAIVWLIVFVLLTIAELLSLVWLADGGPAGDGSLATFVLWSIGVAMAALIVAPAVYLAIPLLLPLDLIPAGLKKAIMPKVASEEGRGFVRTFFSELEGALDRAADSVDHPARDHEGPAAGEHRAG